MLLSACFLFFQTFPGSATSGNITLPSTDVAYSVQVTALIDVDDELIEGPPSPGLNVSLPTPGMFD